MNNLEFLVSNLALVRWSGRVDFASEQVDFQPDRQVGPSRKISENFPFNIFPLVINFKILLCSKSKLGKLNLGLFVGTDKLR